MLQVRGYKKVIKHFSHEASELHYVLQQLEAQDPEDHNVRLLATLTYNANPRISSTSRRSARFIYNFPLLPPQLWCNRYILLLWLSVICMLPFDMHVFDDSTSSGGPNLPDRILSQCRRYLQMSDLTPIAAAQLAARCEKT